MHLFNKKLYKLKYRVLIQKKFWSVYKMAALCVVTDHSCLILSVYLKNRQYICI